MSQTVEFIFFQLKSSVKPEDPTASEESRQLLDILHATKQQSGHHSSAWGRTVEEENVVAWVIVWNDARGASLTQQLTSLIEPGTEVTTLYTTLVPSIIDTETLTANPVTELCALAFPTSMTPDEHKALSQDLINFRTALTEHLPEKDRPKSWAMGQVERPGAVEHQASSSGEAFVHFLAVGWESVEKHLTIKGSKEFMGSIKPIREKMLTPVGGLKMKHVSFQRL